MKKARLIPIDCGNDLDAEGQLLRQLRSFQKEKIGRLEGYVAAFMVRQKNGQRRMLLSAHGRITRETQMLMSRDLYRWMEEEE